MTSRWPVRLLSIALALVAVASRPTRRARPQRVRRVLIAHHLLLGDTLVLAPLLKKLRAMYADAEIVMTCRPPFAELYASRPYGVRAVPFDPRRAETFWSLYRERGFDLAILPADNRYSWLARALDSRWIVAFEGDRPAHKNWLIDELRRYPDHAMAFGDLVAQCLVDGPAPAPYELAEWPAPPAADFALPEGPYCVLHVGASTRLRHWEPEKWRALIARLEAAGLKPVLSAGPGEEELIHAIDAERRLPAYAGSLTLTQVWRLLAGATAVVCPDTGVSHLARLVGVRLVVLFGPGSATMFGGGDFWRNVPGRKVTIPKFPCRDANIVFRRHLPWAEHCARTPTQCAAPRCMQALTVDMVVGALESLGVMSDSAEARASLPSTAAP